MKDDLVALASKLGFDLCRVAECVAPPHADEFRAWLDAGCAGEMEWLKRNKDRRTDPQQVLPGARSVIVLAMNYWQQDGGREGGRAGEKEGWGEGVNTIDSAKSGNETRPWIGNKGIAPLEPPQVKADADSDKVEAASLPLSPAPRGALAPAIAETFAQTYPHSSTVSQPAVGKIARYAWGDDYHDVIERKLKELDGWLIERGGRQRHYVDTGPVLERDFAALAGIGWHGKSTMLIHPRLGTWFFLAEILTTLALEPDAPLGDHCGKCTRCMVACPTNAITAPQLVDARRCISYLTIENKGPIPEEFRVAMGDRIYGCDDCLSACPWNRFAVASRESAFAAREFVHGWSLRDFLTLDDDAFRTLFRKSPIKRIKRRGFLRNVCVALGNTGSSADLPALERAAQDPEPLIAEHAAWAIARIRDRQEQLQLESGIVA